MQRKLITRLRQWKDAPDRKPLILWGARQVGKTWLMKEFGESCFTNYVYISFYNNRKTAALFESDYDTRRIIQALEVQEHCSIEPHTTLIIFDEVQNAPKVLESLKYFCEESPEYAVIAAGSLLGVSIHEGVSFPVGKVNELHLYPMDFEEFLLANNEPVLAELCKDYTNPLVHNLKESYITQLKNYYFTGGMPECVKVFCQNHDYDQVREIQNAIISQYEGDFGKHVQAKELPRLRMVWNALPMQLAKENKKFFFGQIKKGARQKDFEIAIQWLSDAGLIHKVHKVSKPAIPLKSYIDFSSFKIFMCDIGLLGAMSELDAESILEGNSIFTEFKGALTEQYVLQQLISCTTYTPYYYSGEKSTYETDFLIQKGKSVIPIEVKAEENLKSKSLKVYCDKFKPELAIRTSMANYRNQEWMMNIPLWSIQGV